MIGNVREWVDDYAKLAHLDRNNDVKEKNRYLIYMLLKEVLLQISFQAQIQLIDIKANRLIETLT